MKRYAFLARLEELLAALPEQEREDALTYYEEYLDAAGKEQEAAIAALGTPEEVAGKILEGEGLAAPAPAPKPGEATPPPPPRPEPPKTGEQPPAPPAPKPGEATPLPPPRPEPPRPGEQPPAPPAPKPGEPTPPPPPRPEPPRPGEQPPAPPAGGRPAPPHPGAEPPRPAPHPAPAPVKGGQAWKIAAVVAAAVVALALIAMAFEYAEERAEHRQGPAISAPAQQGGAFSQPAQSTAAQPQTPTQEPAPTQAPAPTPAQSAASGTAQNTDGTQTIGNDTTYAVNSADGTATVATAATELELHVQYGDVTLVRDDTVTQPTVEIAGAEQGTFDVKREKNELRLTDLRRGTTAEITPVTVTVRAPAALREADIEVGTGSITLQGALPLETSVHVGSGDITAESISVQELDAETGNGGISLGRVEPQSRAVSLDFVSGSGDIAVTVVGDESDYQQELKTGTGSITVNGEARARGEYNRRAANELDAETGSGSIALEFIAQ